MFSAFPSFSVLSLKPYSLNAPSSAQGFISLKEYVRNFNSKFLWAYIHIWIWTRIVLWCPYVQILLALPTSVSVEHAILYILKKYDTYTMLTFTEYVSREIELMAHVISKYASLVTQSWPQTRYPLYYSLVKKIHPLHHIRFA